MPAAISRSRLGIVVIVVIAALAGVLIGVVVSRSPSTTTTTTSPTSTTTTSIPVTTTPTTVVVPPYVESENARSDVNESGCAVVSGALTMTGTVDNSQSVARTFTIVVDFVTVSGASVIATRVVTVPDLGAHKSTTWTSRGTSGISGLTCVIQFALAKDAS
jgi:hypothetical protein